MRRLIAILIVLLTCLAFASCTAQPDKGTEDVSSTENQTEVQSPLVLPPSYVQCFENNKKGIYNYCPAVVQEGKTRYLYYCTNTVGYNVTDSIALRVGTVGDDGACVYGEETIVLSPSAGAWDARHVCDPSVVKGTFSYKGETYAYLLAYLGCTSSDNQENKIGIAVAKAPTGPFVKVGDKPLVDFSLDTSVTAFQWGVGQPSLVSMDKAGKCYLFYTIGDKNGTRQVVEKWDFSSLDQPVKLSETSTVSVKGLYDLDGNADHINNADFALMGNQKTLIMASDCHPCPSDEPNYVASSFRVCRLSNVEKVNELVWFRLSTVGQTMTGRARNHNVGIVRDAYGMLPDDRYVTVIYTVADGGNGSLWTYRLYEYSYLVK